jgi:hypothetical protein
MIELKQTEDVLWCGIDVADSALSEDRRMRP